MRAQAQKEATEAAIAQVEQQVKKTLEVEKAAQRESLKDAIMNQRIKTEDLKLMVQLYVRAGTHDAWSQHLTG